ncbi:cytotoxic and regulatory T-cell molecule isoform X2 [Pteropus medius]|uniref:cytotoxic and regulatory T-cell molecule isoform X2 n=1 Tax=Pteropus vampyrus TaxID=132908 RepID=UPI00196B2756|nr:cytotoxic and regulatory T-cell molecule isoform X2 [Pteropus giganteus]
MDNQQDTDSRNSTRAAELIVLRFLQNLHKQVAAKYILQPIVLSTMWVKLFSVVVEFCFSSFLVTDQETASDALEKSSSSSQDPQQPTSTVTVIEDSSTSEMEEEEQTTQDPDLTTGANSQYTGLMKKKSGILLLTLVSFLIFILFIIVQLFIMKLRKAHVIWKKENEISEHTLESYKSRSNNEETSSQEKNSQTTRSKSCMNYITQLYSEAKIKQKENAHHSKLKEEYAQMPESIV